jgi:hypothetical protein
MKSLIKLISMKLKRPQVVKYYRNNLDDLYTEAEAQISKPKAKL